MAVARAQIRGVFKRMFSGGVSSIPHPPPHRVSSPQIPGDNNKFSFLDGVHLALLPTSLEHRTDIFIKPSYLKGATQEEKMDFYIKTAARVTGSEEEAKERIYKITRDDCSVNGFGMETYTTQSYKIAGFESVERISTPYEVSRFAATVYFKRGEMIHWSMIPERRRDIEKGRLPLPKPGLDITDEDTPYVYMSYESDSDYD
ncbi:hypothetical protein CASFOL_003784 [Castilleja foliolosa]|uniref:MORF/ORRM1/DAG-like MORF domain-containing protein n=1 Tax=Castilleja foliolosa TaxID=1961234 RepID=A0ABD3EI63_9LAMI